MKKTLSASLLLLSALLLGCGPARQNEVQLLNASYDPTRELYQEINQAFEKDWAAKTGQTVNVRQSHAGSAKQARAVIDGLAADVVTLALAYDVDALYEKAKLIPQDWQKRLPDNSAPYTSTIVFLVRKGNPKGIKDWDDLARQGISVVTPNPKTSGGARWNYLAAWGWALKKFDGDEAKVKEFMAKVLKNVPVFDTGARGATTTFVQRGVGDVLICWENEALLSVKDSGTAVEIIVPSRSILAEPTVTVVDQVVDRKGTRKAAEAYLNFLYTPEGQDIIGRNFYRPRSKEVLAKYASTFPKMDLFTIDDVFGGWQKAQKTHFNDGGVLDQLLKQ